MFELTSNKSQIFCLHLLASKSPKTDFSLSLSGDPLIVLNFILINLGSLGMDKISRNKSLTKYKLDHTSKSQITNMATKNQNHI